eukprot:s943_g7.t1
MFSCIADLLAPGFNSVSLACSVTQSPGVRLHAGHSMADMWQDIDGCWHWHCLLEREDEGVKLGFTHNRGGPSKQAGSFVSAQEGAGASVCLANAVGMNTVLTAGQPRESSATRQVVLIHVVRCPNAKQKRFAMVITAGMYVVKVNQVEGDAYLMKKELKTLGEMRMQLRRRHEQVDVWQTIGDLRREPSEDSRGQRRSPRPLMVVEQPMAPHAKRR